jgi:hypothetical protein
MGRLEKKTDFFLSLTCRAGRSDVVDVGTAIKLVLMLVTQFVLEKAFVGAHAVRKKRTREKKKLFFFFLFFLVRSRMWNLFRNWEALTTTRTATSQPKKTTSLN